MESRTIRWVGGIIAGLTLAAGAFTCFGKRPVPDASADSLKGNEVQLERVFQGISLDLPVWMTQPPGSSDWYAVEQRGRIVTFPDDAEAKSKTVVLDISDQVKFGGEQGLLGLAFHPQWPQKPHAYVNYTSTVGGDRHTRVSRFTRLGEGPKLDPKSEKILMKVDQPYANHNGGEVLFGPDGYLYVGFGDGGLAGDPQENGQDPGTILGSMVRIDVDGGDPYGIPKDNPFADSDEGAAEVWAWGLRNPWRFSFDRKTGALWAGDVGQNAWEEVDIVEGGKNYGWNIKEGTHCYDPPMHLKILGSGDCGEGVEGLTPPVFDYSQENGDRSVTGGYVYRGGNIPKLQGKYVYGDYVSGRIWAYDPEAKENELLVDTPLSIASFWESKAGEIGVLSYADGRVYRLAPAK